MYSIKIKYKSGIYILEAVQTLKATLNDAWIFFSKPENLRNITPPKMNFEITSGGEKNIYKGQIITYTVNALSFYKSNWVTEITQIRDELYFIDEQRMGPYKLWHHEHHFEEVNQGVKLYDKVVYKVPFGLIGRIAHKIFIKDQLLKIFDYRYHKTVELFNKSM